MAGRATCQRSGHVSLLSKARKASLKVEEEGLEEEKRCLMLGEVL